MCTMRRGESLVLFYCRVLAVSHYTPCLCAGRLVRVVASVFFDRCSELMDQIPNEAMKRQLAKPEDQQVVSCVVSIVTLW